MAWWRRPCFELKVLAMWVCLVLARVGMAISTDQGALDSNLTVNGADKLGVELDPGELMDLCLAGNDRRAAPPVAADLGSGDGTPDSPVPCGTQEVIDP